MREGKNMGIMTSFKKTYPGKVGVKSGGKEYAPSHHSHVLMLCGLI